MKAFCKNIGDLFSQMDIFNFLRGIALLCVLGIHTVCVIFTTYPEIHYSTLFHTPAAMSMWMFFFLSGYLLGKGFYNGKYKTNKNGIIGFYISRFVRIVPMYLLFIFILFLFYNPMWFLTHPKAVLRLLTFTYNGINPSGITGIGALWFVSTIVQLYIFAPFVYKFILSKFNNKSNKLIFWGVVSVVVLGLSYRLIINFLKLSYADHCFSCSFANMDLFFGGMLLNAITMNSKDNKFKQVLRPISLITLFTLIILYIYDIYSFWVYSWICPTFILVSMLLIAYSFDFADKKMPAPITIVGILKNPLRIIEYLGIISFTFYLYHSNIIEISMKIFKDASCPFKIDDIYLYRSTFILMFVLTFILSVVVHYILEMPCNTLRNRLLEKINK